MNTNKHMIYLLLLTSLAFSAACSSSVTSSQPDADLVPVVTALPEFQATGGISFSGRVEAEQTAYVSTRVMGTLEKIHVREGDRVRAGDLLVSISNADVLAKKRQVEAMVAEAKAALENAEKDMDRFRTLYAQESVSPKELENVTLQHHSARSRHESALQMLREVEVSMDYTRLKAPFDGVVVSIMADEGSMANPGMPLAVVEQGGRFQISASVSESDVPMVNLHDRVMMTIKSTGRTFTGSIMRMNPSSQTTGGQYLVKISIPDSVNHELYSGMYVNAFLPLDKPSGAFAQTSFPQVLSSAIVHRDQLTGLYLMSDRQTASLRWVRLGKTQGDMVEVLSGLSEGEKYIVEADGKIYNGVSVIEKR